MILAYYLAAQKLQAKPALLEFGFNKDLAVCGIRPRSILMVKNGRLFQDSCDIGPALDIFEHLTLPPSSHFFPAHMGFFSYEFAQYLGNDTKASGPFPDAYFALYEQGLVIKNGQIIHHDPLPVEPEAALGMAEKELAASLSKDEFLPIVSDIKERIRSGDVYQVNFSLPFHFKANSLDLLAIYQKMRAKNLSPFMGLIEDEDWQVLSLSPERLFSLIDGNLSARPIAGTKKRDFDPQKDDALLLDLKNCPKENAEHAMLVDLMRNDLNQVAKPGTVEVSEDRSVEFYGHVMHLVSNLTSKSSASLKEIFSALFPGGTITGAPKQSVMKAICELEKHPRGPYTGSLGYVSGRGCDFNILIRSIFRHLDNAFTHAGAGIVIDSSAESEWDEIHKKAQGIKDILNNKHEPKPFRAMIKGKSLPRPEVFTTKEFSLWFLENNDSFSFNIIDAFKSLGSEVYVARLGEDIPQNCTHVVIGPGPGNPSLMPELHAVIKRALDLKIPLLGICLGHQALGHYFGAKVRRLKTPVHGQAHLVDHQKQGLFKNLSSPTRFARYHSLVVSHAPSGFLIDASSDDEIMALRHEHLPIFGVQFHPESYLSEDGLKLLANFLEAT